MNGNLNTANISSSAAIVDTQLATISTTGKVNISALTVGSQATGDLLYASSASAWARLGIGSTGTFLSVVAGVPAWTAVATQTQMEAASDNVTVVTPLAVKWNPGVAKAWALFNGTGTPALVVSHNVDASITDNGTGDYTLSWTTDFSSGNYAVSGSAKPSADSIGANVVPKQGITQAAGTFRLTVHRGDTGAEVDFDSISVIAFGDQ